MRLNNIWVYIISGWARGLLSSRHLGFKVTDFTDFHPIFSVFKRYLSWALFYTQTPTGTASVLGFPLSVPIFLSAITDKVL